MPQKQTNKSTSASNGEKPQCRIHANWAVVGADDIREKVCVNDLPLMEHTDGNHYCLFHLPTNDKHVEKFREVFNFRLDAADKKISKTEEPAKEGREAGGLSYDFRFVWFPSGVDLSNRTFAADANFSFAIFSVGAYFGSATFSANVYFRRATFSANADFSEATFLAETDFESATFSAYANFRLAKFEQNSQVVFWQTRFKSEVDFEHAIFAGYVAFSGHPYFRHLIKPDDEDAQYILNLGSAERALNLQNTRIERPERISFYRLKLRPSWFVNVDCRKMTFRDIEWEHLGNNTTEAVQLIRRGIHDPGPLLEVACWQLASNAEENSRYEEASRFRRMANDSRRFRKSRGFRPWTLYWWYWLSSAYGESWRRAAVILALVLFLFAVTYTRVSFFVCPPNIPVSQGSQSGACETRRLNFSEGVRHSLATATFQNVEYRKAITARSELCVLLEKIFAPLQAALLALAIRRKFMR